MPRLRIKPFPVQVEQDYASTTWKYLKTAIQDILLKQPTSASFEHYYNHAYNMFLHKQGDILHQNLREVLSQHLETKVRMDLLRTIEVNFLNGLKQIWEDYLAELLIIKDIFMYMDRKADSMQTNLPSIYSMGLALFKDIVLHFGQARQRLQETLVDMITQDRKGQAIDRPTVKAVCVMLMELGSDSRTVYEEDFERAFLAETVIFYRQEAVSYLSTSNAGDYIRKTEQLIKAENERLQQCLDKSTKVGLDKIIDDELIQKHMETVANLPNGGVVSLIQTRNFIEMMLMYKLFNRLTDGVPTMITPISLYLRQQGTDLMKEGSVSSRNPIQLIQSLLDLKKEYDLFLEKSFKKDPRFRRMMVSDFEYFFNLNKRCPEFLSIYIDDQLKNGLKVATDKQLGSVLDHCMILFRYLHEKDVFERFYKHHLARRLLNARTTSDESEKVMLSKLRQECGYSYTSKLEGMYRDILVSSTFNDKFKDQCFQNNDSQGMLDINVQVLTSGFWPMPAANVNVQLPAEAQKAFMEFRKLYLETYSGRQLNLQNNLGTVEISAEFYGAPAINDRVSSATGSSSASHIRRHILHVTTYQMCVLMLFNKQNEWAYQEIVTTTNIPDKDLKRTLATLSTGKMKLLVKLGGGKFTENSTKFIVNDNFYSQQYRIKVNAGAKVDFKEDMPDEELKEVISQSVSERL